MLHSAKGVVVVVGARVVGVKVVVVEFAMSVEVEERESSVVEVEGWFTSSWVDSTVELEHP